MSTTRSDIFEHILHETKIKTELEIYFLRREMGRLSIRKVASMCALASGELRVMDITALMGVTQQAVGRLLQQLEQEGLVASRPGDVDTRENIYSLTHAGFELLKDMRA